MPFSGPRVLATAMANLDVFLDRWHGAVALVELLARVGIDPDVLNRPDVDVSFAAYARLLELCAETTGEECFGFLYAQQFPAGGTGVLGYTIKNAPDLRAFLATLERYLPIQVDDLEFVFTQAPPPRLTWRLPTTLHGPRKQLVEFLMTITMRRMRDVFGRDIVPVKVEFEYHRPLRCDGYEELFGRNLNFHAPGNTITLRSDAPALRNRHADALLYRTMRAVADERLEAVRRERVGIGGATQRDTKARLADYFVLALGAEEVDIERAAARLAMPVAELQAELRRRDTNFAQQLSQARRALAERLLRDTLMPMSDISLTLGFSELSAFTRAAKGWFGVSPSQWRQQQRDLLAEPRSQRSESPDED